MRKLILKITGIATGCAMILGAGYLVQAKINKEVINTKVENLVNPVAKPVLVEEVYWFELQSTEKEAPADQTFLTGTPMPNVPPTTGNTECAQAENEGDYCAVALKFTASDPDDIDTDLTGYTTLQDVLDNHPNAVIIAKNNISVDEDEDGYSRQPL